MRTLRSRGNPGSRTEVGNAVLTSARTVKNEAIAPRLRLFEKAHAAFLAADERARHADEQIRKQSEAVGMADIAQDSAVMRLADALVAEGLPRANPFKPLGFASPAKLARMGYAEEAQEAQRLARAVLARDGIGKAASSAAQALASAAQAVEKALTPMPRLVETRTAALRQRDTLGQAWETQFAGLKLAAQMAEADGATGLFAELFADSRTSRSTRRKTQPPPPPTNG